MYVPIYADFEILSTPTGYFINYFIETIYQIRGDSTSAKTPCHKQTVTGGDVPVSTRNQIPPDTFTEAVGSLDRETFAAFVAETYAATADEVAVNGPRITVVENGRETELLAMSTPDDPDNGWECDAVVTARDSLITDCNLPADVSVKTPADLRQRLLYAISPATADTITNQFLDVPTWSTAYDATSVTDTATETGVSTNDDATPTGTGTGQRNSPRRNPSDPLKESDSVAAADTDQTTIQPSDDAAAETTRSQPNEVRLSESLTNGDRRWVLFAVIGLVALLGLAAVGAGSVGIGFIPGGETGVAGVDNETATDPAASVEADNTNRSGGGSDATATDGTTDRNLTNATARATSVAPTCERSAIHVVQLQMNAFRYNNNTTNTGILTARQFASPSNRAAVGSADQFISLFDMPRYAPMLTYDTVRYSVPRADTDTTTIEVVTQENGTVTGRYDFLLTKVPSDETDANTARDGAECWMTSGVTASPP